MNVQQIALIETVRAHLHQTVTRVERLRYVISNEPTTTEGALLLWFTDSVLFLDVDSDGECIRVLREPWTDPFKEPLSDENEKYVAKHGKWTLFDVSHERLYSVVVGAALEDVLPIANEFGKLIGLSLTLGGTVLNVFVEGDELRVTWGVSETPHWDTLH